MSFVLLTAVLFAAEADVQAPPTAPAVQTGVPLDTSRVYAAPDVAALRARVDQWLADRYEEDADLKMAVDTIWSELPPGAPVRDRFSALVQTFYLADPWCRDLLERTRRGEFPDVAAVAEEMKQREPFLASNVGLFVGHFLAVATAYDEALYLFEHADAAEVVDPATYLFYRAVCEHALLQKQSGLATIDVLLEQTERVPGRYEALARLMKHDLELIKEESLDEVARQMKDVRRRLKLGEGGERTIEVEERIIATLDKLIERMEQQQNSQSQSAAGGTPQGNQSDSPAEDSYIGGQKAPGEVDPKVIGRTAGWGDLPEKAQAKAKIMINQQFPAHYRQAVEEYLKKLAERPVRNR